MIALSLALFASVVIVCAAVLAYQHKDHEQRRGRWKQFDNTLIADSLVEKLKELAEIKAKVDALALKAGFTR